MKIVRFLTHLFIPHESNNQKAKILHSSSLIVIAFFLILSQVAITIFPRIAPSVLGYAAQISPSEVIRLTNEKRAQAGLPPLTANATLSSAAQAKGADMLAKGYWAHVAPDGTQPWAFFINFGYQYRYAGENLARDFSSASSAVDAWMNSPSHRENMLNPHYKDVGIGVVEGNLAGADTTIIVQFFGAKYGDTIPAVPVAKATTSPLALATLKPTPISTPVETPSAVPAVAQASSLPTPLAEARVLISPFTTTKGVSLAVVGILLAVLIVDGLVVSKRRIARIGGRTFAHIAFLGMILAIALILKAGRII